MDLIQSLVSGAVGAAVITGAFALAQLVFSKKLRGPGDRLASEEFAYKVIRERLEEANADRAVLTDTVNYLREDAKKRDVADQEDFDREQQRQQLVRDLNKRIADLESQITAYEGRLARLAEKVRRQQPITLSDIYDVPDVLPEDFEDTIRTN